MGFVLCRRSALEASAGNAHSLSMDLHDQWQYMTDTGQWRYTPPTHVVAAFWSALQQYAEEGGLHARGRRYRRNSDVLREGMIGLGFEPFLPEALQAPIIHTFLAPDDDRFLFADFYARLRQKGFIIYPGKTTDLESFRIGCIGAVDDEVMRAAVSAVAQTLEEMGVTSLTPAAKMATGD